MPHQVFISYASVDKAAADRVCRALENAGASCWMAPRNIGPGTDYPAAIVEAIHSAGILVLLLTEQAAASPHILSEVGHAFNGRKRIVPFRLSAAVLPDDLEYFLAMTQWLDASDGCTDRNLGRLTEAVLDGLANKEAPHGGAPSRRRLRWLAPMAALAASAAALVYWKSPKPAGVNQVQPVSHPEAVSPSVVTAVISQPKTWLNPADGENYVWIAPGRFTMGCSAGDTECNDDEKPRRVIAIGSGFWLGRTEVTIAAYRRYSVKHGLKSPAGDGALPISDLTWADAKKYCQAIAGRLPTEAEWEYAARGGDPEAYYGVIQEIAWYAGNGDDTAHPVATKSPNAFGLYDMLGNVAEWVLDRYYNKYYVDSAATGSGVEQPLAPNASALARGGSFQSEAASIRVSRRFERETDAAYATVGFRCASDHP